MLAHEVVLFRQGLRRLLEDESDIEVVTEAGNAAECLRKLYELRPDVLMADAGLFGLPSAEVERRVRQESSETRTIFLLADDAAEFAFASRLIPSENCTLRQTSAQELVRTVRNLAPPRKVENDAGLDHGLLHQDRALTARERDVLKLLAQGKTVREAASVLGLSNKTVDAHKFNLMRKLNLHNKAELVMWAVQKRMVKIPVNF
ncbi:MAG TPA: response regulator transcription factor [Candidatus Binatia bacterium]|nr:response regulator transcription factor [Candidatus Binatia bacterium]